MMKTCELFHVASGNIYLAEGELLPGSAAELAFQAAADPTLLGFEFVESAAARNERLAAAQPEEV